MNCDKPECGGLFRYQKHAPACALNPANLKRPADAPRAGNTPHRAQEADDDDDSEADAHEADESYMPDSDGANSTELFFDARETPSKHAFFDARESPFLSAQGYHKRHRRKQIAAAEAAVQAPQPKPSLLQSFVKRCTNLVRVSSPSPTDRNETTDHYFSTKYHKNDKATRQRQSKARLLRPVDLVRAAMLAMLVTASMVPAATTASTSTHRSTSFRTSKPAVSTVGTSNNMPVAFSADNPASDDPTYFLPKPPRGWEWVSILGHSFLMGPGIVII